MEKRENKGPRDEATGVCFFYFKQPQIDKICRGSRHLGLIKGGVTPSKKGAESNEITLARYLAVFAHSSANICMHLINIYRGYSRCWVEGARR